MYVPPPYFSAGYVGVPMMPMPMQMPMMSVHPIMMLEHQKAQLHAELQMLNQYQPKINQLADEIGINRDYIKTDDLLNKYNPDYEPTPKADKYSRPLQSANEVMQSIERLDEMYKLKRENKPIPFVDNYTPMRKKKAASQLGSTLPAKLPAEVGKMDNDYREERAEQRTESNFSRRPQSYNTSLKDSLEVVSERDQWRGEEVPEEECDYEEESEEDQNETHKGLPRGYQPNQGRGYQQIHHQQRQQYYDDQESDLNHAETNNDFYAEGVRRQEGATQESHGVAFENNFGKKNQPDGYLQMRKKVIEQKMNETLPKQTKKETKVQDAKIVVENEHGVLKVPNKANLGVLFG
jgi:hypothetical protein